MTTDHELSEMHRRWEQPPDELYDGPEDEEAAEEARERAEDAAVDRYVEEEQERRHRAR
jgi:hypothetical protein